LKALQDSISKQNLIFGSSGIPFIIAGSGEPESQSTFDISFSRSEGGQLKDHGGRSRTGWAFIELLDLDVLVNRTTSSSSPQYVAFLVNYVMIVNIGSPSFLILACLLCTLDFVVAKLTRRVLIQTLGVSLLANN
jgi:hypothetical protein